MSKASVKNGRPAEALGARRKAQGAGLTPQARCYPVGARRWVQGWLVPRLKQAGLRVCVDVESFEPGAPAVLEMERAVVESRKTVLVLTAAYLQSKWTLFENVLASTLDPGAERRRIIPLVLEDCDLSLRVRALVWLDFRDPRNRETAFSRLVSSVRPQPDSAPRSRAAAKSSVDATLRSTRKRYLDYLRDRYQHLDFRGMGISDRVALQLPLVDMYVPLKARPELPEGEAWSHELRVAGRKLTREEAAEFKLGRRLPVLVPLSAYAQALTTGHARLDDFVDEYYRALGLDLPVRDLVARALADGEALLLDGLDEVREQAMRREVVERVVHFFTAHRPAGNKFVLTSRIVGYRDVRPAAEGLVDGGAGARGAGPDGRGGAGSGGAAAGAASRCRTGGWSCMTTTCRRC